MNKRSRTAQAMSAIMVAQEKQIDKQERALFIAQIVLEQFTLNHKHNEEDPNYRRFGEDYGWCSICSERVGLNSDLALTALTEIKQILGET